jgi:hypothetical protein
VLEKIEQCWRSDGKYPPHFWEGILKIGIPIIFKSFGLKYEVQILTSFENLGVLPLLSFHSPLML